MIINSINWLYLNDLQPAAAPYGSTRRAQCGGTRSVRRGVELSRVRNALLIAYGDDSAGAGLAGKAGRGQSALFA